MKYRLFLLFIATLLCAACDQTHGQGSNDQDAKSLLWQVSSKQMKKPSYLFGTIHLICPEDYLWTPAMDRTLKKADEVCFEMDMDDPSLLMEVAMGMVDMTGKTIKEYFVNEADYKKVAAFITDSLGMNLTMFQQLKPAALQALFATKAVSCAAPVAYENNIMELAKKQGKEITGLEKASEQLALFDNMPIDSVIKDLVEIATDYGDEQGEYKEMVASYKKQDLSALNRLIEKAQENGEDMRAFLDERNNKWIERMVERMDQRSIFFAVGAGHLGGKNGVITLLRKAGYTVTPIK